MYRKPSKTRKGKLIQDPNRPTTGLPVHQAPGSNDSLSGIDHSLRELGQEEKARGLAVKKINEAGCEDCFRSLRMENSYCFGCGMRFTNSPMEF